MSNADKILQIRTAAMLASGSYDVTPVPGFNVAKSQTDTETGFRAVTYVNTLNHSATVAFAGTDFSQSGDRWQDDILLGA